jgi:DNA repair exonuclease SbcCD ATPase subunit
MSIPIVPEPLQEELEVELRSTLSQLDAQRAATIAAADQQLSQLQSAMAAAGSEYDTQVAGAQQAYGDAQTAYDDLLTQTSAKLTAAQTAIEAIDTTDPTISSVSDIVINTGGTPDCAAADIEAAVNAALTEIRKMRDDILTALTNGNVGHQKDALQALKDTGQAFRDPMPAAADLEAEKAAKYAVLDGMYP